MSNIISGQELLQAIKDKAYMENGKEDNCEGIKYDFRLGEKILKACFKRPVVFSELSSDDQGKFFIAPGEVVFVITEERLTLPPDVFCQLSNKRKIGHGGIILLGGLIVDPSYKGHLVFGLYNVSSKPYILKPHRKLIAGVFYKTENERTDIPIPDAIDDFPDDLVDMISKYEPFSPANVAGDIQFMRMELDQIKNKLNKDDEWKTTFKEGLSEISSKLNQLTDDLKEERMARKTGDQEISGKMNTLKGIGIVLGSLVGGGLVSLLVLWLAGVLSLG